MAYKSNYINGDLNVGHNESIGGSLEVKGKTTFRGGVKIEGFLEAEFIKDWVKGLFEKSIDLYSAYPNPQPGWVAYVGSTTKHTMYVAKNGNWEECTDGDNTLTITGDLNSYTNKVNDLQTSLVSTNAKVGENTTAIDSLKSTTQSHSNSISNLSSKISSVELKNDNQLIRLENLEGKVQYRYVESITGLQKIINNGQELIVPQGAGTIATTSNIDGINQSLSYLEFNLNELDRHVEEQLEAINADQSNLHDLHDQEVADRKSAITSLRSEVNQSLLGEAQERMAADSSLGNRITTLSNTVDNNKLTTDYLINVVNDRVTNIATPRVALIEAGTKTIQQSSVNRNYDVVFLSTMKCFAAKTSYGYFSNWMKYSVYPSADVYGEQENGVNNGAPSPIISRLYTIYNELYIWDGNNFIVQGKVDEKVTNAIAEIIANAPEDLDTLKEVADYIASDKTKASEIETAINNLQLKDKEHDDELQVIGDRVTTEINSIRSSTPVFANIVDGDVDLKLGSVTSNYTVVYLENKKVFAALNAGKYWANWRAWGKYPSADSYGPAPAVGKVYIMGNALYVWNGSSLQEVGDFDDIKNNAQAIDLLAEELETKAPKVGYAPDLKVDFAKELVGRGVAEPQVIGNIRPTGLISIGDGNATIEKVKGKSVVWNQISDAKNWINNGWEQGIQSYSYADGVLTLKTTRAGNYKRVGLAAPFLLTRHKVLVSFSVRSNADFKEGARGVGVRRGYNDVGGVFVNFTSSTTWASYAGIVMNGSVESNGCLGITYNVTAEQLANAGGELTLEFKDIVFYDLTRMFGAGNEPTTIEEFNARKPLNVSNDYNDGEIISYDAQELKSVGFNAFNGTYAKVIGGEEYHAVGTTNIGFSKELGGETTEITLDDNGRFTPSEDGYVYAGGTDIVIHLTHSYTPKHVNEYQEDTLRLPDIKAIKDKDGNQLFPYGLLSAGSVYDEITATKAVKRVGQRAFTEGDNENTSVLTDGTHTIYALTEPIEVDLADPFNMTYEAWDFGTEELVAEGKTTPLNADIVYQFNAVDRIRENTAKNQALEAEVAQLKAMITQLTQMTNEENSNP